MTYTEDLRTIAAAPGVESALTLCGFRAVVEQLQAIRGELEGIHEALQVGGATLGEALAGEMYVSIPERAISLQNALGAIETQLSSARHRGGI